MDLDKKQAATMSSLITDTNNFLTETNGSSNGVTSSKSPTSSYDSDVIRIIAQHLVNMGFKQTVDLLLKESGVNEIEHPMATKFQHHILAGDWDRANAIVEEMSIYSDGDKEINLNEMRLLIAEQKFLESIEDNLHVRALKCLRLEITPLTENIKRIQFFTALLMCKSIEEVKLRANWSGKGIRSRQDLIEKFERFIPPVIMLPANRLSKLLSQAIQLQNERCRWHIPDSQTIDLKIDHRCSVADLPVHPRQELDGHKAEVWFCKFSNDGSKLATGGLGGKIKIWNVDTISKRLTERCTLDCMCTSITCLSWSPNDSHLLACGSEDRPDLWIWDVRKEEVRTIINHTDEENTTTCSWHSSGDKFAAASIKGNLNIYDLDGIRHGNREGVRIQCLSFLYKDPSVILAADYLNRIKAYAVRDISLETDEDDVLKERHPIMSFTIDREDRYIAVNLFEQGVHLWDYKLKTLLRMFPGVCQRNFTIYSSFSNYKNMTFLASGSEDGKVYIYDINKDQPIAILEGHSRCVNCVSWNPVHQELLVSASDDKTVKLWAPLHWNPNKETKKSN